MDELTFVFACPRCATALSGGLKCANCGVTYEMSDGIHRFLLPERCKQILPFLMQYRSVREREGYRLYTAEEYRNLPDVRVDSPQADVWRVRRESYHRLLSLLNGQRLAILDLGAGNGWLSHRLAVLGNRLVAVDWLDDTNDGLGVYRQYPVKYLCVQADFNALPFVSGQFDAVIFNASLHYAANLEETMQHASNMLKPKGRIYVMDSPTFGSNTNGQVMVREQIEHLRNKYGLPEVLQPGAGYLTSNGMIGLGNKLGIDFRFHQSRGAFMWEARRWWGGVKSAREPAAFGVWAGSPRSVNRSS